MAKAMTAIAQVPIIGSIEPQSAVSSSRRLRALAMSRRGRRARRMRRVRRARRADALCPASAHVRTISTVEVTTMKKSRRLQPLRR